MFFLHLYYCNQSFKSQPDADTNRWSDHTILTKDHHINTRCGSVLSKPKRNRLRREKEEDDEEERATCIEIRRHQQWPEEAPALRGERGVGCGDVRTRCWWQWHEEKTPAAVMWGDARGSNRRDGCLRQNFLFHMPGPHCTIKYQAVCQLLEPWFLT